MEARRQNSPKENYGRNIVQGHKHAIETHYHTDRRGGSSARLLLGRYAGLMDMYQASFRDRPNERPIKHYEDWQNGLLVIRDYGDSVYEFNQVPIRAGCYPF